MPFSAKWSQLTEEVERAGLESSGAHSLRRDGMPHHGTPPLTAVVTAWIGSGQNRKEHEESDGI
jgi:hypothetical protein